VNQNGSLFQEDQLNRILPLLSQKGNKCRSIWHDSRYWRRWHKNEVHCLAENRGLALRVSTLKIEYSPTSAPIFGDILPAIGHFVYLIAG
jgi:hypothetical protein